MARKLWRKDHRKSLVVHGEDEVLWYFATFKRWTWIWCICPYSGTQFDLATGELIKEGVPIRIQSNSSKQRKPSTVYERLLAAGQRLLAVIKRNEGGANKDLAKFADQVQALCDKWDR